MNGQVDLERRVSDWLRTEAPARASDRVLAQTLDRVAVLGQERSLPRWSFGGRSGRTGSSRLVLIAATVALLLLLVATAVLIGGPHENTVLPVPSTLVVPTTDPVLVPSAPPLPARIPTTTAHAGSAATDIGQVTWTALDGDLSNLPSGQVFDTPNGFAAIEPELDGSSSRFWTSSDGLKWTVGTMPVPADGTVGHAVAAGEHWIWSARDLRLWRSADFVSWSEVDLAAVRPPVIDGVRWTIYPTNPATIGSTTVMTWRLYGFLVLDELLGIDPEPGTTLIVGSSRDFSKLGEARAVSRVEATVNGPGQSRTQVGSIRVTLKGDTVSITDVERDIVVAEIDARVAGVPAATLANGVSEEGAFPGPAGGTAITGGTATAFVPPPDVTNVVPIDGRFIALTDDYGGGPQPIWASTDGLQWASLGRSVTPSSAIAFQLLPRPDGTDPNQPLTAAVVVDGNDGTQRPEIWSSTDGLNWQSLRGTSTDSEAFMRTVLATSSGFLGIGDDNALHVSATGARWTVMEGIDDLHKTMDDTGGMSNQSTTRDRVFMIEVTLTGQRRLWVLQVAPSG